MSYRTIYKDADSACWRKIANYYRKEISSGKLTPGSRLPSTQELAEVYETSVYSVQYALAALTHEGLVSRRPRYGTVVNEYSPGLKVVGILILMHGHSGFDAFRRSLVSELSLKLQEMGCEAVTVLEDANAPDLTERVRGAIRKLGIQAIIPFTSDKMDSILQKINIPRVYDVPVENMKRGVNVPREEFAELAVNALAKRGCRRPGLITVFTEQGVDRNNQLGRSKHLFFETYRKEIERNGMEFCEQRIFRPLSIDGMSVKTQAEHGYRSFMEMWNGGAPRPDSLVVFTDELMPGIAQAIARCDIKVPEELTIVTHSNSVSDIFLPFETINIELDVEDLASALLEQLVCEFNREKAHQNIVHYKIK